ncbi:hypothetical protein ACRALDRAFT_1071538 [Sodiomyces alcalophilus JCM 7366]|uniref:uncharacterized protein n=1 Tax=Sodiomyces alcalophilus JCM 7366 TaxID=591952 RepID=UPI0039B48B4F
MTARRPVRIDLSDDSSSEEEDNDVAEESGFFDLEAADEDDESDDSDAASSSSIETNAQFHQFNKLPIELRRHIWSFLCPDLAPGPRILMFWANSSEERAGWAVDATFSLLETTKLVRLMMATHHESRALALRRFPNTLDIWDGDMDISVPFNKETDIVHLNVHPLADDFMSVPDAATILLGFSDQIVHLAVDIDTFHRNGYSLGPSGGPYLLHQHFLLCFPELKTFYTPIDGNAVSSSASVWAVSDHAERLEIPIEEGDYGETNFNIYRWHKPDTSCRLEGLCEPLRQGTMGDSTIARIIRNKQELLADEGGRSRVEILRRIQQLPMIYFTDPSREEKVKRRADIVLAGGELSQESDWSSTGESGSDASDDSIPDDVNGWPGETLEVDPDMMEMDSDQMEMYEYFDEHDEYESEGIDDASIAEPETDDDSESSEVDGYIPIIDLTSGGHHNDHFRGFSPLQSSDESDDTMDDADDSDSHSEDDDSEDGGSKNRVPAASRTRQLASRRVIMDDSDGDDENMEKANGADEDVEDDLPVMSRSRRTAKRRIIVDDSDDSDD